MITTALTSSCHWKTVVPFCVRKKIPENAFSNTNLELSQNRTENQIMLFKTTLN